MTASIIQTEILNDLITINNDRMEGYNKAVNEVETGDVDLKVFFSKMTTQSRENVAELQSLVNQLGGDVENGTTISGKVYRVWMDIKSVFTSNHREGALDLCEYGEDAAQHAYSKALESSEDLEDEVLTLIKKQQLELKESLAAVKKMRDSRK